MSYRWQADGVAYELKLAPVPGTNGAPYHFGHSSNFKAIEVRDFAMSTTQVTQALWLHVMGANPSRRAELLAPVENVSWDQLHAPGGFLDRLNAGPIRDAFADGNPRLRFRLPTETEWEYAARGGPHWRDGFAFSGSNDPDEVGWIGPIFGPGRRMLCRLLGWKLGWRLSGFNMPRRPNTTHPVGLKAPNQLGIYDLTGNVWEWCEDVCVDDLAAVPADGTAYTGPGEERRWRGGCHTNWDIHCTVWWRYGLQSDAHDGCVGVRLVLA